MRHFQIILLALAVNFPAFAQTSNFYRTYNFSGMQGGLGIVSMPDGGFVGTGQHQDNGSQGECDIYVYRVDACGNLLWMKLIGDPGQQGGKGITRLSDNTLAVVGLYVGTGYLAKLDMSGNLVWEHRFAGPEWTTSVTELSGGDLVVSGFGGGRIWLMRTDPSGNIVWSRCLNSAGQYNSSVVVAPNGNIFVDGTYGVTNGDMSISCFDPSGNLLWANAYGYNGFPNPDHEHFGSKLFYDPSDQTLIAISQTFVYGNNDILLMKVDASSGAPVWSKVIGDGGSDQARDIVKIPGGYAILGNSSSYNFPSSTNPGVLTEDMSEKDVLLFAVSDSGSILWARSYGGNNRDKGIGLRYNGDGSFLISAYTASSYFNPMDFDPLFIRTDNTARLACQYSIPNPTAQNVAITAIPGITADPGNAGLIPVSSVMNSLQPTDRYVCLSCVTDPLFVPSDTVVCVNEPVYFYNTTTYGLTCFQQWSINNTQWDGSIDTLQYVFDTPGTYPILLYSNCGASTDTFRINIRVNPYPEPGFDVSGNCLNDSTRFNNTSTIPSGSISTWQWSFGDGFLSTDASPFRIYSQTGTYMVVLSATSESGCMRSDTDVVVIHPLPVPGFTTDAVCMGEETPFFNNSFGPYTLTSYSWDFGDGGFSVDDAPGHVFPTDGRHFVSLEATDINGCRQTFNGDVIVHPNPKAAFMIIPADCDPSTPVSFINRSSGYVSARWDFGDGVVSDEQAPNHHFRISGSYPVQLVLTSDKGCIDSLVQYLELQDDFALWIPNAFTPNGDQVNDVFFPLTTGVGSLEMRIFDRWGQSVFETYDKSAFWDAKMNGVDVPSGVYVYKLKVLDNCGDQHDRVGRVTVIR